MGEENAVDHVDGPVVRLEAPCEDRNSVDRVVLRAEEEPESSERPGDAAASQLRGIELARDDVVEQDVREVERERMVAPEAERAWSRRSCSVSGVATRVIARTFA